MSYVTVTWENVFSGSLDKCKAPVVIKSVITILHFISRLSMIVWVNVVLNRAVVVDSDWRFAQDWNHRYCEFTVTLIPTLRPASTLARLRQRLYRTSEAPLKLSKTITRILQPYNIRVAYKPITTLPRPQTNVKDKDKPEDRQGTVYKIKCCDCQAIYIGETVRNLSTRLTEHKRATRDGDVKNHIANRPGLCYVYYVFYRQLACESIRFFRL